MNEQELKEELPTYADMVQMFEVTPELVDYLAEVACLEKPYAKHVLEIISRMAGEGGANESEDEIDPITQALRNLDRAIAPAQTQESK